MATTQPSPPTSAHSPFRNIEMLDVQPAAFVLSRAYESGDKPAQIKAFVRGLES
jgi:hypothetical protein